MMNGYLKIFFKTGHKNFIQAQKALHGLFGNGLLESSEAHLARKRSQGIDTHLSMTLTAILEGFPSSPPTPIPSPHSSQKKVERGIVQKMKGVVKGKKKKKKIYV